MLVSKGKYISLEQAVKIMRDPHMDLQEVRVPKGITELLDILNEALNQIMDNGEKKLRELEYVEVWEMTEENDHDRNIRPHWPAGPVGAAGRGVRGTDTGGPEAGKAQARGEEGEQK